VKFIVFKQGLHTCMCNIGIYPKPFWLLGTAWDRTVGLCPLSANADSAVLIYSGICFNFLYLIKGVGVQEIAAGQKSQQIWPIYFIIRDLRDIVVSLPLQLFPIMT